MGAHDLRPVLLRRSAVSGLVQECGRSKDESHDHLGHDRARVDGVLSLDGRDQPKHRHRI